MGITSGTIHDALIAQCALKAGAETLYTWNARHRKQLGAAIAGRATTPH